MGWKNKRIRPYGLNKMIDNNKIYKYIDKDLINGYCFISGKKLNQILEDSYKQVKKLKK